MLIALLIFRIFAIPQLQQFSQIQDQTTTATQVVAKHPYAAKIVVAFLLLVAVAVTILSFGLLDIDMVLLATYLTLIISLCILFYFTYLLFFAGLNRHEKVQVLLCFILLITAALFWSAFEQKPTSFNLFARDYTDRMLFGFEIPTVWFQSINALFIVVFAPIAAWLWVKLSKSNKNPGYISKFVIALLLAASGFLVMAFASQSILSDPDALVSPLWLVSSIFLLTLGELCLSPVGLSAMTKLAPNMIRGQMMGLWFTASALGNLMAGLIGGQMLSNHIENLPTLFFKCVFALMIGAVILLLLKPFTDKLLLKSQTIEN